MSRMPMPASPPIVPVILSGGAGTRLWPLSREIGAEAVHAAAGRRDAARARRRRARWRCPGVAELVTVTNRDYYFHTQGRLCRAARRPGRARRRSCSSRSAATRRPRSRSPRYGRQRGTAAMRCMLVLPADHLIRDQRRVRRGRCARGGACARRLAGDVRHRADARRKRASATSNAAMRCAAPPTSRPRFARRRFVEKPPLATGARIPRRGQLRLELRACSASPPPRFSPRSRATRRRVLDAVRPVRERARCATATRRCWRSIPRSLRRAFPTSRSTTR